MAKNWRDVRAEAVRRGTVTEEGIAGAARVRRAAQRAYRLAEVRKRSGEVQTSVAKMMGVSQAAVSKLEGGDLEHTQVGTLDQYVTALGGTLHVVAEFDGETLELS